MTDETQGQDPSVNADAVPGDDPNVATDGDGGQEPGQQTASDPTPDTGAAEQTPYGEGGPEGQEGSEGAEAPDPAGVEPGETQSVPTLRGPGPDDGEDDGQA